MIFYVLLFFITNSLTNILNIFFNFNEILFVCMTNLTILIVFDITAPGTAPRKVEARPLSSSTVVIQWAEPETPNGQVTVSFFFVSLIDSM